MDYLGRDGAPLTEELWSKIDSTIVDTASKVLVGRRLISIKGPIGAGLQVATIDQIGHGETFEDGVVKTTGRKLLEVPQIYSDFWLYWRDLESAAQTGVAPSMAAPAYAALQIARQEDNLIFYGNESLGIEGLLTAKGVQKQKRKDWSKDENAFMDVAEAIGKLEGKGFVDTPALAVSPDIFLQLQRIQPGTGVIEADRIQAAIGRKIYKSTALKAGTAALFCTSSYCVDILLGQDMTAAYLEAVDMNHHFRIMETVLPRVKCPEGIVVLA